MMDFYNFCLALMKYNLKEENLKSEAKSLKGKKSVRSHRPENYAWYI